MRLAYVCQYFTTEFRGPVTNLMHELSKKVNVINYSSLQKHMQYYRGGAHESGIETISDRLTLKRYKTAFKISGLLFPRGLSDMLAQDRPDIVQSEEYYQPATRQAMNWAKKEGVPLIVNHRGSSPRDRTLRERAFFGLANPSAKPIVDYASAIICLSKAGKQSLLSVYPGIEDKIRIVPNSIDPHMYRGANGDGFRKEHGIPAEAPLLMCVSRLHPQKRLDLLIRSFARVKMQIQDAMLAIIGPSFPKERAKLDSIIAELGLTDIIFTGPIPNEILHHAYAAADVCAMTSEYEPFGYSLLEGMAQSKPQVAFGIGAVPEIIANGVTGYAVPYPDTGAFGDRVSELLADHNAARRMGTAGLTRVKDRFSLKTSAEKLVKLYEEVA